jgi:hypothetical protein
MSFEPWFAAETYKVSESLLPFKIAAEDLIGFLAARSFITNSRPFSRE